MPIEPPSGGISALPDLAEILNSMVAHLPLGARRLANASRVAVLADFLKFGVVGAIGFVFDTAIVYGLRSRLGLIGAGLVAYVVAATITWALNRAWTFRGRGGGPAHRQWARFLVANGVGFVLNRGTYIALVASSPLCAAQPVLAVAAGCLTGMGSNFVLSRALVFR